VERRVSLPRTLGELVENQAERWPDRTALRFEDGTMSYGLLAERGRRAAGLLHAQGLSRGDRLGIIVGNALDLPVALLGAAHVGVILVPLHSQHRGEMLRYMTTHADASLIVVDTDLVDEKQLATVRSAAPDARLLEARFGSSKFLEAVDAAGEAGAIGAGDVPLSVMYTSGTSGRSKGVVLDQRFYLIEGDAYCQVTSPTPEDVFGTVLPLAHANAQIASLVGSLLAGVPLVCWRRFSASRFWSELDEAGVTIVNLLGAMAPILLKTHPERTLGHRVRLAVGGAIPPADAVEFRKRFGVDTREVFGLTEVGIACGETDAARRLGSAGLPLEHWHFRIDGAHAGEIQIRGQEPSATFRGYWRDPERTAEAFTEDGWFRSGDLGRVDADGFLYFMGRIKDCIRRRGENVSPDEIEMIVNGHPGVAESAAVAVASQLAEDEIKLAYIPVPDVDLAPEEVHNFCVREMASFMVPRYIERREFLPRTSTLKIIRSELTSTAPPVVDMAAR
jgi:carnitine-CoA ligase